jgi:hypothetical protein
VEIAVIAWLYWVYDALNNLSPIRQQTAIRHANDVFHLERVLHLDVDWTLDRWTAHHHSIGLVLSDFYDTAHLWAALAALVWLWWWRPAIYPHLRNVLVGVNVVGFLVFWLYPVAPPRMLPGFIDVVVQEHAWFSWHGGTLATHANQLAAMPSLHISWALWVAIGIWYGTTSRFWRGVGIAHVVLTTVSVIATGNHYTLDVVAGAAAVGVSAAGVSAIGRIRGRRSPNASNGSTGSTANSAPAASS